MDDKPADHVWNKLQAQIDQAKAEKDPIAK